MTSQNWPTPVDIYDTEVKIGVTTAAARHTYTIQYNGLYLRAPKSWRIASLIFCTEPNAKRVMKKTKKRGAQKKWSVIVRGVSPEAGREFIVGKVCE